MRRVVMRERLGWSDRLGFEPAANVIIINSNKYRAIRGILEESDQIRDKTGAKPEPPNTQDATPTHAERKGCVTLSIALQPAITPTRIG